jgi:hypothetical protein
VGRLRGFWLNHAETQKSSSRSRERFLGGIFKKFTSVHFFVFFFHSISLINYLTQIKLPDTNDT